VEKVSAVMAAMVLAGCASHSSLQIGENTFQISRQGATGFVPTASLRDDVINEGTEKCRTMGKDISVDKIVTVEQIALGGVGGPRFPSATVEFTCIAKNEQWKKHRPIIENVPGEPIALSVTRGFAVGAAAATPPAPAYPVPMPDQGPVTVTDMGGTGNIRNWNINGRAVTCVRTGAMTTCQ
jgi:hypothetical protein